jgi:hypothetical protein
MHPYMKLTRGSLSALVFFAFALAALPVLSSAHWNNGQNNNSHNCSQSNYVWNGTTCASQDPTLLVYVQVPNQSYGTNLSPSNFTVSISGNSPSPASFTGSLSGTQVVFGAGSTGYSATVVNNAGYGFTPSYSTGCSGTLAASQSATCVITVSASNNYYSYPQPYVCTQQYPYSCLSPQPLTCSPSYQTVSAGQTATFVATGGTGGSYNWTTPSQTYLGTGSILNTSLPSAGTQNVTVTNGSQTANCTVNVVAGIYPSNAYNTPIYGSNAVYPTVTTAYGESNVVVSYVTPNLPNTGFAPQDETTALAFAVILLLAVAGISYPYVRSVFATVLSR